MKKVRLKQVVQKVVQKAAKTRYFSLFEGVCAGAAAGLVTVFFRWALGREDSWLHAGLDFAASRPWMIPLWFAGLLAAAGGVFALLLVLNRLNVYRMCLYLIPSILLWVLFLHSGVHATIAGVLIAMTIPATPRYSKRYFGYKSRHCMDDFRRHDREGAEVLSNRAQMEDLERLSRVALQSISPSQRLEHGLHHTVAFFIMPVFALANAGVTVDGLGDLRVLASGQGLGIFLGLVLGKPLGIFLLSRLCVRLGWGALPEGATWRGLLAVSCLGGIGFTMSIFINTLAFGDPVYVASGKIAVLAASFSAIGVSLLGMRFLMRGKASET